MDSDVRKQSGVEKQNKYIFANTGNSETHCNGWETTNYTLKNAKIDFSEITATAQRIRMSTLYAACFDVNESDQELFYKHISHTEQVNKGTFSFTLPYIHIS